MMLVWSNQEHIDVCVGQFENQTTGVFSLWLVGLLWEYTNKGRKITARATFHLLWQSCQISTPGPVRQAKQKKAKEHATAAYMLQATDSKAEAPCTTSSAHRPRTGPLLHRTPCTSAVDRPHAACPPRTGRRGCAERCWRLGPWPPRAADEGTRKAAE